MISIFLKNIMLRSLEILQMDSVYIAWSFLLVFLISKIKDKNKLFNSFRQKGPLGVLGGLLFGVLMPTAGYGSLLIAIYFKKKGFVREFYMSFLTVSAFLNPGSLFLTSYLFGKDLGGIYILSVLAFALGLGIILYLADRPFKKIDKKEAYKKKEELMALFSSFSIYYLISVLIFSFLMEALPRSIIDTSSILPKDMVILDAVKIAIFRMGAPLKEISFAGGLIASGAEPGVAISTIMLGLASSLVLIFSLYKFMGKKTAIAYPLSLGIYGGLIGRLTNKIIGKKFHYIFDLEDLDIKLNTIYRAVEKFPSLFFIVASLIIIFFACLHIYKSYKDKEVGGINE